MSADYQVTKPKDFNKINSKHFGELIWWSFYFGITLEKLVTIVDEIGDSRELVKGYVDNRH